MSQWHSVTHRRSSDSSNMTHRSLTALHCIGYSAKKSITRVSQKLPRIDGQVAILLRTCYRETGVNDGSRVEQLTSMAGRRIHELQIIVSCT